MLKRFLFSIFGHFTWTAPPWLDRGGGLIRAHLLRNIIAFVLFILLAVGGWFGWHWHQSRPKPVRVTAIADPIPVTKLEKELKPAPLTIRFSGSVAKLDQIGKPVSTGVRLDPVAEGKWSWTSDSALTFKPAKDWPADQKYRVSFDKNFFRPHVLLERDDQELRTTQFTGVVAGDDI